MALQRKYLINIAKAIRNARISTEARKEVVRNMAYWIKEDNPQADMEVFYYAASGNRQKPVRTGLNLEE